MARLVPVLSHGRTGASFKSWQDWFDLIFLTLPQGRAGCPLVADDVAVGARIGRLKSGSCSENFLTVVRCGGGSSESSEVPWAVGTLNGAMEQVHVVLKVHVGRHPLEESRSRCRYMGFLGEVLDGGGLHDDEVLCEFVTFVEWNGAW